MAGHVFIVKGDLTRLACDAWLLPCDHRARPSQGWVDSTPGAADFTWPPPPAGWARGEPRVMPVSGWPHDAPQPWLASMGGVPGTPIGWYVAGATAFVDGVAAAYRGAPPRHRRARLLLGVPVVGTGEGGAKHAAGDVVRQLIPALRERARSLDVDVAIVAREEAAFAAAQAERRRAQDATPWAALSPRLLAEVDRIAEHAARGRLVLFVGGGVGRGAGVPLWDDLLGQLATQADMSDQECRSLGELDLVDRARVIGKRLKGVSLGQAVAELLGRFVHHSLSHALLAALPVSEVVTTNYDRLFEDASRAAGIPVRVLPGDAADEDRRWVLKMHGSIDRPEEIVLTREDYLRYEERRAALAGIVQALLITRHMLFVGFALRDENFHRIADAVRKAMRPGGIETDEGKFGTALALLKNPLQEELWEDDLYWTPVYEMAEGEDRVTAEATAGRRLEIFLDCLLARTASVSYLMHPGYTAVLSDAERALGSALADFARRIPEDARHAPAWKRVAALLTSLGWHPVE
jgi:hypothetical protein